jgi:hypothetical protein
MMSEPHIRRLPARITHAPRRVMTVCIVSVLLAVPAAALAAAGALRGSPASHDQRTSGTTPQTGRGSRRHSARSTCRITGSATCSSSASAPAAGPQAPLAHPAGIRATYVSASSYCRPVRSLAATPCGGRPQPGYTRLRMAWPSRLLTVSFTPQVTTTGALDHYEFSLALPRSRSCPIPVVEGQTTGPVRAGRTVLMQLFVPDGCRGVADGVLSYVAPSGSGRSVRAVTALILRHLVKGTAVWRLAFTIR